MGQAVIFQGSKVKALKKEMKLGDGASRISGTLDPTSTAVDAVRGSLYQNETTGVVYRKTDNGSSTNWTAMAAGETVSNGMLSNNDSIGNKTIASGTTLYHPLLNIKNTHVYTVQNGGALVSIGPVDVEAGGTLTINAGGTVKIV